MGTKIFAGCLLTLLLGMVPSVTAQTMQTTNSRQAVAHRGESLGTIQRRGKLRVGVKDNVRPLGFRDDQGQWQGLEIALARRLALELLGDETAVELIPVKNQDRLALLLHGEVDLIIAQMGQNSARDRLVDFSPPYYLDGVGLITKNPQLTQLDQGQGKTIAVLNGSAAIAMLKQRFPDATLVGVDSYQEAYETLEREKALAFAGDNSILSGWSQSYPDYHYLPVQLSVEPLAIAMVKGLQHQELQRQVNQTVLELKSSGWLRQQWQLWQLPF